MTEILHQQRLLLELLVMSGNIAVPDIDDGTLLYATLKECEKAGWLTLKQFGAGFAQATIKEAGRQRVKNRRSEARLVHTNDKRRTVAASAM